LHNIEKRMKNLGGSFNLVTKPGAGTCIQLEVPAKTDPKV
jgi:signal transduction histidine kinase